MNDDLKHRLGGAICLLIGGVAAWWGVWLPIERAQAGAPVVSYPLKIVVLVPLCIVFGMFFVVCGNRHPYRDVDRNTLTPLGWTLFAVIGLLAFAAYFWLSSELTALGYD